MTWNGREQAPDNTLPAILVVTGITKRSSVIAARPQALKLLIGDEKDEAA